MVLFATIFANEKILPKVVYLDRTICHKGHVGAKGNDVVGGYFH
jgi:hypothetical protein